MNSWREKIYSQNNSAQKKSNSDFTAVILMGRNKQRMAQKL